VMRRSFRSFMNDGNPIWKEHRAGDTRGPYASCEGFMSTGNLASSLICGVAQLAEYLRNRAFELVWHWPLLSTQRQLIFEGRRLFPSEEDDDLWSYSHLTGRYVHASCAEGSLYRCCGRQVTEPFTGRLWLQPIYADSTAVGKASYSRVFMRQRILER